MDARLKRKGKKEGRYEATGGMGSRSAEMSAKVPNNRHTSCDA